MRVALAAVVQQMVQSEKSGVAFTVDPLYQDPNLLAIEAGYGLGELVVSGQITPDTYRVDKTTMKPIDKLISKQTWMLMRGSTGNVRADIRDEMQERQKLSDQEMFDLAKICVKIEEHYQFPQDIEWAYEKGNLYITQSRPITTLKEKEKMEIKQKEKKSRRKFRKKNHLMMVKLFRHNLRQRLIIPNP